MGSMKTKFSTFQKLFEGDDYGIAHLEDLDVESFIRAVEKLHKLEAVQKLDGANLRAGLDEKGELYTSREQKGGKRFYKQADFPKNSAYEGFRAAHEVLFKIKDILESILAPGESMNIEVIYGEQPNTVFYGKDGVNYLAILEMLPGDDPSHDPDQGKVAKIVEACRGKTITVKSMGFDTTDGVTMVQVPKVTEWKITKSDHVPKEEIKDMDFEGEIAELKRMLDKENVVADKLGKHMTNFEVLKDRTPKLADERQALEDKVFKDFKEPIKQKLLKLVYKQKPSLRGMAGGEGAYNGIEGIIFTDPKTREKFKVVDKDVFTKINQFNYSARKQVTGRILTNDPNATDEAWGGIVCVARLRSLKLFGMESVDVPNQTKKVLAKFRGDSREETVKNIADSLHQLNFQSVKRKLQAIYIHTIDDLDDALDSFKKSADEYELELEDGKKIKYTPEIKRRTLMTFAEARKQLYQQLATIRKTQDIEDLIEAFFKSQLDSIHGGSSE